MNPFKLLKTMQAISTVLYIAIAIYLFYSKQTTLLYVLIGIYVLDAVVTRPFMNKRIKQQLNTQMSIPAENPITPNAPIILTHGIFDGEVLRIAPTGVIIKHHQHKLFIPNEQLKNALFHDKKTMRHIATGITEMHQTQFLP